MFKPVTSAEPNTLVFETFPLIKVEGFRDHDSLWWLGVPGSERRPDVNLLGAQALGMGFGTLMRRRGWAMDVVTGHDFRSYSLSFKLAFTCGLLAAGAHVKDVGLAVAPLICHSQSVLDAFGAAFVTASHHQNGWIGIKFGTDHTLAIETQALFDLKNLVLSADFELPGEGTYETVTGLRESYLASLTQGATIKRPLKVVVASANGTAGLFAPQALENSGCQVIGLDVELDHTFPRHIPDPADPDWLEALERKVVEETADVGFAFDGAGERCGVVGNDGRAIPSSKISVLLAREIAATRAGSVFTVDTKWKALFNTDPVLQRHAAVVANHPGTASPRLKQTTSRTNTIAEFQESGRFTFYPPLGRGCEDGLLTALLLCRLLDHHANTSLSDLCRTLPPSFVADRMAPTTPDDMKHYVVEHISHYFRAVLESGESIAGQKITELHSVNGVKIVMEDGTWAQIRASSDKAELIVVVESPISDARRRAVFDTIDTLLRGLAGASD